eukprot:Sspe_Gene.69196::Locus_40788_Transcript_1_1_Confidence_1.000_Length_693::g.69196::m.69196/K12863/CWC15; protein CWC15
MTTAHRPTFTSALASDTPGGNRQKVGTHHLSARDLPGQLKLKTRHDLAGKMGRPEPPKDTTKEEKKKAVEAAKQDADKEILSSDESDYDDEDEEELLKKELAKIKKERQEEAARQAKEEQKQKEQEKEEAIMKGNPLLNEDGTFATKRRWDDDVVFKNQARSEPQAKRRFINDSIRNDFHRKFLDKYMR